MKTQDLRAALAAERRRREEAESKLSRALENNTALARGNLRLQEQCARLRGEADLRQHEEGCQRAAAAAREQEAAAKLARLQALVQRGAEEREALLRKLAGKQEVIAYLENKLAERAAADDGACGSNQLGAGHAGGAAAAAVKAGSKAAQSSGSPATSLDAAAPAPAGQEARQRVASEEEEALPVAEEASSGSPDGPEDQTPAPRKHQPTDDHSAGAAPPTLLRTSLRARNGISYAEPSLNRKLRQGDPFTFGTAEAAAAGAGKPRGRARTKPRPRFAAGAAQHNSEERREALPPVAD